MGMISSTDLASIERQLGRRPNGDFSVVTYTPRGEVQVIKSAPFMDQKPFPNLYWLVCEKLKYAIDRIEAQGWVKRLEDEILPADKEMQRKIILDHYRYMRSRWALVKDTDLNALTNINFVKPLAETGIGGIADFTRVRCLHMHYAFHLAEGSTLGQWLEENFKLSQVYAPHFELSP